MRWYVLVMGDRSALCLTTTYAKWLMKRQELDCPTISSEKDRPQNGIVRTVLLHAAQRIAIRAEQVSIAYLPRRCPLQILCCKASLVSLAANLSLPLVVPIDDVLSFWMAKFLFHGDGKQIG